MKRHCAGGRGAVQRGLEPLRLLAWTLGLLLAACTPAAKVTPEAASPSAVERPVEDTTAGTVARAPTVVAPPSGRTPSAPAPPGAPVDASGPRIGSPPPALALPTLDGPVLRPGDLQGRTVLVNFWASWCVPCREEMPALQALYDTHRADGFLVVAINQGRTPPPPDSSRGRAASPTRSSSTRMGRSAGPTRS